MTGGGRGRRGTARGATAGAAPVFLAGTLLMAGCGLGREAPRGDAGWARLIENRAWIEEHAAVPGTTRAWLRDGLFMTASCREEPRFASWRWTGETTFEWDDGQGRLQAEVAMVGPDELVLMLGPGEMAEVRRYRAAPGDSC
jgi:hypothetical protein